MRNRRKQNFGDFRLHYITKDDVRGGLADGLKHTTTIAGMGPKKPKRKRRKG